MRLQTRHAIRSFLAACATMRRQNPTPQGALSCGDCEAVGIIETVDPIGRELTMKLGQGSITFYVPLSCAIVLNDERVKLRLLQSMDRAVVRYSWRGDLAIAKSVVVDWKAQFDRNQPDDIAHEHWPA